MKGLARSERRGIVPPRMSSAGADRTSRELSSVEATTHTVTPCAGMSIRRRPDRPRAVTCESGAFYRA